MEEGVTPPQPLPPLPGSAGPCLLVTWKMQYWVILKLSNQLILLFSVKPIPLLKWHRGSLFCFCFNLILSIGLVNLLFNFTMEENWNRINPMKEYNLFNLVFRKDFGGKIKYKLHCFAGNTAFHRKLNCCFVLVFSLFCKTQCATKSCLSSSER